MSEEFMSFDKFAEVVLEMDVALYAEREDDPRDAYRSVQEAKPFEPLNKGRRYLGYLGGGKRKYGEKLPPQKWCLLKTWQVGGVAGGNCWNSGGHYSLDGESEPSFDEIDQILMKVCPNLSFVAYKELMSRLNVEESEYTESEYYGNYTNYKLKTLFIKDLYSAIVELYGRTK